MCEAFWRCCYLNLVRFDEILELFGLETDKLLTVLHDLRKILENIVLCGVAQVDTVVNLSKAFYAQTILRIELILEEFFTSRRDV